MPSVSKSQQHLMGMAHAVKSGKKKLSEIPKGIRAHIEEMIKTMSDKQLADFASTPTGGLPVRASVNRSRTRRVRSV